MPDTFGDLRASLDDLAGLDLDPAQRDALINEGHREIATRSEWYRAEIELGPTVAAQVAYTLPSDVYRVLNLTVGGLRYEPASRTQITRINQDERFLLVDGLWWQSYSATNVHQISLYPTPGAAVAVNALVIERPPLMTLPTDVPVVPEEFRQAIADYAAGIAFASVEDNADMRVFYSGEFERKVADLRRLTFSTGRSVAFWERA